MRIEGCIAALRRSTEMNKNRQLEIEKIVGNIRNECNISDYGVKDVFEASEKLGYRNIRFPIGEDAFLGISLIKEAERIIFSNSSLILSREIFTVAHGIGHQKLHLSEQGKTLIKDDDLSEISDIEVEANYFAACFLMPKDKIEKFIRLELKDRVIDDWDGLCIAKIQAVFNVSYDMVLVRLTALNILNETIADSLKKEKIEQTAFKLLSVIGGNMELCRSTGTKKIPADFLEWAISNYNEKLIPLKSLEKALSYGDLIVEDINVKDAQPFVDEGFDELLRRMR